MIRWIVLSVLAVFLSLDVLPALAANIEFEGDFRVRGFYTDNLTDQSDATKDEAAYNSMRFLMTTTVTAGIGKGVVTLDYTSQDNTGNLRFGSGGSATTGDPDVFFGPADDRFALLQAYIEADLKYAIVSAGRKLTVLGHSIIFDDTADLIAVSAPLGPVTVTVADLKVIDSTGSGVAIGNGGTGTGSDTDVYVGNINFVPDPDLDTNLILGYIQDRGPAATLFSGGPFASLDWNSFFLGVTADVKLAPFSFGGEIDFFNGSYDLVAGGGGDIEGLNVEVYGSADVGPANLGLTVLYASGQDPSAGNTDININGINGNYPTGIILTNGGARSLAPKDGTCLSVVSPSSGFPAGTSILGEVPNCIVGSGLFAIKGTGSMRPMERVTLQADVIWAQSAEDASAVVAEKDIGIELDGTAKIQIDENLSFLAGIGYLITGDFWKPAAVSPSPDDMIVGVLELNFVF